MITSDDLAFFSVLAGSASLAQGARKLNVTAPAVTQRLRALEARVGMRLIDRSGRQLTLTDEGALVAAHGTMVAETIERLSDALADRANTVSGHLRIASPHGFGRMHVAPVVEEFSRTHPGVSVMLALSDHLGTRMIDNCDVVIHIGPVSPMNQIVTTLAPNRRVLCASPSYLENAPPITAPADLVSHRCLVMRENDEDVTLWRFQRGDEDETVRARPGLASNDSAVIRDWTLAGRGLVILSEWSVAADLAAGRLTQVLPEWETPSADIVATLGVRHGRAARTTAFLALLRQSINPAPWRIG